METKEIILIGLIVALILVTVFKKSKKKSWTIQRNNIPTIQVVCRRYTLVE